LKKLEQKSSLILEQNYPNRKCFFIHRHFMGGITGLWWQILAILFRGRFTSLTMTTMYWGLRVMWNE